MISTNKRLFDEHTCEAFRHLTKAQDAIKAGDNWQADYHLELAEAEVQLMRATYNRLEERSNAHRVRP